jgi:hypothetical protein
MGQLKAQFHHGPLCGQSAEMVVDTENVIPSRVFIPRPCEPATRRDPIDMKADKKCEYRFFCVDDAVHHYVFVDQ